MSASLKDLRDRPSRLGQATYSARHAISGACQSVRFEDDAKKAAGLLTGKPDKLDRINLREMIIRFKTVVISLIPYPSTISFSSAFHFANKG